MDALDRIQQMMDERGWTMYRLARESGINDSTIINSFRRHTQPSIQTLEAICKGFGISMSEFFCEGRFVELTPELKDLFDLWLTLTPDQKNAASTVMKAFAKQP